MTKCQYAYNPKLIKGLCGFYKSARIVSWMISGLLSGLAGKVGKADDIETVIHVMHLAGDAAAEIANKIECGAANFVDGDIALEWGVEFVPLQDVTKIADA